MAEMKVKGTIDTRNYERGVDRMRKKNKRFGGGLDKTKSKISSAFKITAIVAFVGALARGISKLVSFGSELNDLSQSIDVNIENMQAWTKAIEDGGGKQQDLVNAMNRVRDAQGRVADGDETMIDAVKRLGISTSEFISLNTEDAMMKIAKSLTASGNEANRMNAVADMMGTRALPRIINGLNMAAGGLDKFKEKITAVDEASAAAMDAAGNWANTVMKNAAASFTNLAAGVLTALGLVDKAEIEKTLRTQERKRAIAKQMREEAARINEERKAAKIEEERLAKIKEIREEEKRILKERAEKMDEIADSVKIEIETDAYRKMGGLVGNRLSREYKLQRQELEIARRQEEYQRSLPKIEKNTRDGGLQ